MYKSLLVCCMLALSWQYSSAQKDSSMNFSLKQAVDYAKSNSYAVKNARLDEVNSKAKVKETLATGLPQVNGSLGFNNNFQLTPFYFSLSIPGFPTSGDPTRAGAKISGVGNITASQLIFDGTYLVGLQASKEFVKLSQQLSRQTEEETEMSVSKSYYMVLIAEENINLLESNIKHLEKTLQDTRALFTNGFAEKIDVDRLDLSLSELKLQNEKLNDSRESASKLLKMQMGLNVDQPIYLTDKLEDLYKSLAQLPEKNAPNASNRIEYQLIEQNIRLHELNMKRYKVGFIPTVSATYNFTESSFRGSDFQPLTNKGWYSSSFIGLSMNVPLFDGFRKQAWMQQTRVTLDKLSNDKKNFENVVAMQTFKAQSDYETTLKQTEIRKNNMKLAENIYTSVSTKFKNGVSSSFELTQAENDLKTAQVNFLNSLYDLLVAKIELNKALGKPILN